jgi:uncharacterized protein (TIGR03083 family)
MIPRPSTLDHQTAMQLAATEYDRCLKLLGALQPADWGRPTGCPAWDVRQLTGHMLGMVEMAASGRESLRQLRLAAQAGGDPLDALTGLQVGERRDWSPTQLVERFAKRAPKAVAGRKRLPSFLRSRKLPQPQRVNGAEEPWTIGFLTDVILTRDPWMHRIDISAAIGRPVVLTADHDGAIVAGVVAEWTDRHGKDFSLTLYGPAGGRWTVGVNGPSLRADAIEFCMALSGRPSSVTSDDIFNTEVPF